MSESSSTIEWASGSDVGQERNHNEDAVGIDREIRLAVLADGMGGYNAGEVASAIAVQIITEEVQKKLEQTAANSDGSDNLGYTRESIIVKEAILQANKTILQTAESQPQCHGMGTTVVVVLFYDNRMTIAHLGDSRLYRVRDGLFEQMTIDHSLVQELEDLGHYTHEEAINSPQKNYITRAMGVGDNPDIEIRESPVMPGDLYMICSDGLSDQVGDDEILNTLREYPDSLESAVEQLIKLANDAGGLDNISVILMKVQKTFPNNRLLDLFNNALEWLRKQLDPERLRQLMKNLRR